MGEGGADERESRVYCLTKTAKKAYRNTDGRDSTKTNKDLAIGILLPFYFL